MVMNKDELFVDIDYCQSQKHTENICGDAFTFEKVPSENRLLAVMSDGLGSGVKANILASMTATMALKFASAECDILYSAEIMMSALPVCQTRKISYSTFTIVNTALFGRTKVIEMGNPRFLLIRNGEDVGLEPDVLQSKKWENRTINIYDFEIQPNDRMIILSDGITQAGMGSDKYKLGWRRQGCLEYVKYVLQENSEISSHHLSAVITREAKRKEPDCVACDDMTCAVIYFRKPKKMLIFTGPPFFKEHDNECARMIDDYNGQKVICGGTSADIISRELQRPMNMDLFDMRSDLPPTSKMAGIDLITEGIFTLTKTAQYLEAGSAENHYDGASQLLDILRGNDIIEFVVGTKINDAHQDPNLPVDLEIRRNIVKRIAGILREKYLKEVTIRFV